MKTIQSLIAASVLYVFSATAYAEDWYILMSVGGAQAQDFTKSEFDNDLKAFGATGIDSSIDTTTNGFKMQAGYRMSPNFALEGGYVDFGNYSYQAEFNGGSTEVDYSAWGLNFAGVGILPLGEQIELFGKLGLLLAEVNAEVGVTGLGTSARDTQGASSLELSYGLGANYNFADAVTLRIEWERYADVGDEDETGESDIDLITIGLALGF